MHLRLLFHMLETSERESLKNKQSYVKVKRYLKFKDQRVQQLRIHSAWLHKIKCQAIKNTFRMTICIRKISKNLNQLVSRKNQRTNIFKKIRIHNFQTNKMKKAKNSELLIIERSELNNSIRINKLITYRTKILKR